jgi:hypothetical protein
VSALPERREAPRTAASGSAWLTARSCRQVAAGTRIEATISDISSAAVGLAVTGTLWQGDQLVLHGRLFGVELDAAVAVASARRSVSLERILLGRAAQDDLRLGARYARGA